MLIVHFCHFHFNRNSSYLLTGLRLYLICLLTLGLPVSGSSRPILDISNILHLFKDRQKILFPFAHTQFLKMIHNTTISAFFISSCTFRQFGVKLTSTKVSVPFSPSLWLPRVCLWSGPLVIPLILSLCLNGRNGCQLSHYIIEVRA